MLASVDIRNRESNFSCVDVRVQSMSDEHNLSEQADLFDKLADEKRLRILQYAVEGPVAAPELAKTDDFEISSESILYHMNLLESAGFLVSSTVQGPYKRPRKEFRLSGNGKQLTLEVVADEYFFDFREPSVAAE